MVRTHIRGLLSVVTVAAVAAACGDSPSGVNVRAAAVEPSVGFEAQTATVGTAVPAAPAVLVRNARGEPSEGVSVWFKVTAGGGAVASSLAKTNAQGIASAGSWTLGTAPGPNTVVAEVTGLKPVEFTATAVTLALPPPQTGNGAFDIEVRYIGEVTERQRAAVNRAVALWSSIIVGDLPSVHAVSPAGSCFTSQPALNEVVDDLLIFVEFKEIDGPGKILGEAGPCYLRSESRLPIIGQLRLDAADLERMEGDGTLDDVVTHEVGHVLGFGTLWKRAELIAGVGTEDPLFSGAHAYEEYRAMGGAATGVPVENTGSTGTREGHWRESVFGSELMTGYIRGTPNPLSAMSAASLRDLGYSATTEGVGSFTLGALSLEQGALAEPLDLGSRERILPPRYEIDRDGRRARLPDEPR